MLRVWVILIPGLLLYREDLHVYQSGSRQRPVYCHRLNGCSLHLHFFSGKLLPPFLSRSLETWNSRFTSYFTSYFCTSVMPTPLWHHPSEKPGTSSSLRSLSVFFARGPFPIRGHSKCVWIAIVELQSFIFVFLDPKVWQPLWKTEHYFLIHHICTEIFI